MKRTGTILLLASVVIFVAVTYLNSRESKVPLVFSPATMLTGLWRDYKEEYILPEGRTIDLQRDSLTTSEGQSYVLLRAVWMDDKESFDRSWAWTRDNLRREDGLFAWLYGERPDGTYGTREDLGGQNSASDADTDIALALIFAYSRWREAGYLQDARRTMDAIWKKEVVEAAGKPILAANDLEQESPDQILVNPSYFAPYAYRIFAELDPNHEWMALVDSSYDIIRRATLSPLDRARSANLPPDWVFVDRRSGEVKAADLPHLGTSYGYEAVRLPWRLALDWIWYREPRAKETLSLFDFLREEWRTDRVLYATYGHDGDVLGRYEAPVMYAGSLGAFMVTDPDMAEELYREKLATLYSPDILGWKQQLSYYDSNWAWFGLALYHGALFNLSPAQQGLSFNLNRP